MSSLNMAKILKTNLIHVQPIIEKKSSISKKKAIEKSTTKGLINDSDIPGWIVLIIILFRIILLVY